MVILQCLQLKDITGWHSFAVLASKEGQQGTSPQSLSVQ